MATDKARQLNEFLRREFPQIAMTVKAVGDGHARVQQNIGASHLRPGKTVSGPTMMALADAATYVAILGSIGIVPLAVTTNLNINFFSRPAAGQALIAEAKLLKLGKRLAIAEVHIRAVLADGKDGETLLAHATVTYSIPPERGQAPGLPGKP